MQPVDTAPIAAIRFKGGDAVDALLQTVARDLECRDFKAGGFLQRETPVTDSCCSVTHLEDIATGRRLQISQDLGRASRGCRLDPRALAELSGRLLPLIPHYDILILNRFGKGETEGGGFRLVIAAAVEAGIPVLTSVRDLYLEGCREFTGELGVELTMDRGVVLRWCLDRLLIRERA